jgi:hypothetical protein
LAQHSRLAPQVTDRDGRDARRLVADSVGAVDKPFKLCFPLFKETIRQSGAVALIPGTKVFVMSV